MSELERRLRFFIKKRSLSFDFDANSILHLKSQVSIFVYRILSLQYSARAGRFFQILVTPCGTFPRRFSVAAKLRTAYARTLTHGEYPSFRGNVSSHK